MKRVSPMFVLPLLLLFVSSAASSLRAQKAPLERNKPARTLDQPRQPHKVEQLTKEQFDRLADDEVIDIKGTRMTAGETRAKRRQWEAEAPARQKEAAEKAKAEFEAYKTKFLQEQKAKLDAENAKVREEAARWQQQHPSPAQPVASAGEDAQLTAIRNEARQLLERSKNASPAELQKLEQRAAELLQQVEQRKNLAVPKAPPKRP